MSCEGVGPSKGVRWKARKGAPLEGGAHNSIKSHFKGFHKRGGANPPRGREGMSE
jgi:hypothetical protein